MARIALRDRLLPSYTNGEEIFNMVTHIVGGGLGIAFLVLCIIKSVIRGSMSGVFCSVIYGTSVILLYCCSSIYHGLKPPLAKKVFQVLDHCAIYVLIAGTYTPVLALSIWNISVFWAIFMLVVVWGLTALAITFTAIDLKAYRVFSFICYIFIGWCVVFIIKPTLKALPIEGFILLLAGGILYTIGSILYGIGSRKKFMHSIFHIFVLLGSIAHFLCIIFYVL